MALASARAMVRELAVVEADEPADAKLLAGIADWCDRFTPFVAIDGVDGLLLDVTGATHLFGGEAAMLETVRTAIARQGIHGARRACGNRGGGAGAGPLCGRDDRSAGNGSRSRRVSSRRRAGSGFGRHARACAAPVSRPSRRWRAAPAPN